MLQCCSDASERSTKLASSVKHIDVPGDVWCCAALLLQRIELTGSINT